MLAALIISAVLVSDLYQAPIAASRTARLEGAVKDPNGAFIVNAEILIKGSKEYKLSTDENGRYGIDLPAGKYSVFATAYGFKPFRRGKTITLRQETYMLDITLSVGRDPVCILRIGEFDRDQVRRKRPKKGL